MAFQCVERILKYCYICFVSLIIPCLSQSQDSQNAIYAEAFGPGFFYSINYERFLSNEFTLRGGISIFSLNGSTSQSTFIVVPLMGNYLLGNGSSKFEVGTGIDFMTISGEEYSDIDPVKSVRDNSSSGILLIGSLGYRYQPWAGGLHFRIVATPMLSPYTGFLIPSGGCSLGICF